MKPTRQQLLGGALAATLAATAWTALQPEDQPVAATAGSARRAPVAVAPRPRPDAPLTTPPVPPVAAERSVWSEPSAEQLAAWQPLPPPPPPAAPPVPPAPPPLAPPPPAAPPLPYQMIGRLVEGEGIKTVSVALLASPHRSLGVRPGDVIDGQWRVERVDASGVRLTWLPGQLPQNIAFRPAP